MSIHTQLMSFTSFFIFGLAIIFIYKLVLIRRKILCYIIFPILTTIFTYILFHINGGKIHPYFIIVFFIGIILGNLTYKIFFQKIRNLKNKIFKKKVKFM